VLRHARATRISMSGCALPEPSSPKRLFYGRQPFVSGGVTPMFCTGVVLRARSAGMETRLSKSRILTKCAPCGSPLAISSAYCAKSCRSRPRQRFLFRGSAGLHAGQCPALSHPCPFGFVPAFKFDYEVRGVIYGSGHAARGAHWGRGRGSGSKRSLAVMMLVSLPLEITGGAPIL
jgi:hypothetical protein